MAYQKCPCWKQSVYQAQMLIMQAQLWLTVYVFKNDQDEMSL